MPLDREPSVAGIVPLSDEDLMSRAAADDERAFAELVRRYQGRVINLVSRILNDRECSDDLAQEVFVRVYVHRRNYRRGAKFSTWLFTIAANLAKNEIRRRVRRRNWFSLDALQEVVQDSAMVLADPVEGQDVAMQREQLQSLIGKAIAVVPEKYRIALVLRDVEGLAYEEIGQVLGIPGGTVRSRINRARGMLKRKLQPLLRREGTS
ncbi:MAG: sigma-70 family RNA polymerase sigma factor [Candidatus Eisenbacteria bacterium]|uniref:RNA polymerase sigma factor n=1 Tax=Eiseniibacteriota bacterium TaxID=2212470 RepID=A0A849SGY2_UNCEI|nr:sigma-70 family RNA polymerase sigma factor [Candidatus Eisenbacteria bacterium]